MVKEAQALKQLIALGGTLTLTETVALVNGKPKATRVWSIPNPKVTSQDLDLLPEMLVTTVGHALTTPCTPTAGNPVVRKRTWTAK